MPRGTIGEVVDAGRGPLDSTPTRIRIHGREGDVIRNTGFQINPRLGGKERVRTIFLLLTSILAFLSLQTYSTYGTPGCGQTPSSVSDIQEWLNAHNKYRCLHGVSPLQWSNTIAANAGAWAAKCLWQHSSNPENMAAGFGTISDMVEMWYGEEKNYNYSKPGFSMTTGHFTQVVWKTAKQVGCGYCPNCVVNTSIGSCNGIFVCQYDSGNMIGQFTKNVPPPLTGQLASDCMTGKALWCSSCKKGKGAWKSKQNSCWQIAGAPTGSSGNPAKNCGNCWKFGNMEACGSSPPPIQGAWHSNQGSTWTIAGYPPGWTPDGCWRLMGTTAPVYRCSGAEPDLKGLRVNGKPACWTKVDKAGKSTGVIYCDQ
jgi:hypothetical protein